MKLNSKQLRAVEPSSVQDAASQLARNPLVFILENIYDTYNVGGLFRLADGLAVEKLYLCGETTIPPNNRIHKASCGTYKVVPWEYCKTASDAINKFRTTQRNPSTHALGPYVVAIEQSATSVPYTHLEPHFPMALVLGNESMGVTPDTLKLCDKTAEIPMWGINKSLNVIVSAAIVSFHIISHQKVTH